MATTRYSFPPRALGKVLGGPSPIVQTVLGRSIPHCAVVLILRDMVIFGMNLGWVASSNHSSCVFLYYWLEVSVTHDFSN